MVRDRTGRRAPYLAFGGLVIPLLAGRSLLLTPYRRLSDADLSIAVYWKIAIRPGTYSPEGSTVTGLTRAEADYLDRVEFEVRS